MSRWWLWGCLLLWMLLPLDAVAQEAPPITPTAQVRPLVVWWPDALTAAHPEALATRDQLTNAFMLNAPNVEVQFRLKSVSDEPGGLLPTLRSGSLVAPGVLPDVTLLRRRDVITAQREGLIEWFGDVAPSADLAATLPLGYVEDRLYGLPYMIDVQHLVWREGAPTQWDFETVLDRGISYVFPAGEAGPINDVFYAQYAAGRGDSAAGIDAQALATTLDYYARARSAGLIGDALLAYTTVDAYIADFEDALIPVALVKSSYYLQQRARDEALVPTSIPTADGDPTTILDGWVWVLVTSNPEQRALALSYINWMIASENQTAFARAAYQLPAGASARRQTINDPAYSDFIESLLSAAVIAPTDTNDATLRALQSAYMAILMGEKTVEQAVDDALAAIPAS